ncbi:hypothetical protein F7D74_03015 [Prevotella copri]|uniref:Uncharacterized protein n=1 Tax=Segatella copri TaxID=165179 RepID=A0AA90ZRW8_9BACT|nr:hypothetical protein [Segatella copri]
MATSPMISFTRSKEGTKPQFYIRDTLPPHALKGQKLLAQGNTLGISAISLAPCKGKSFVAGMQIESEFNQRFHLKAKNFPLS